MKLDQWRKSRNLSQTDLARKIGVATRVSVARYEAGRMPERRILERIIEVTGGDVTANDWFAPADADAGEAA